MKTKLIVFIVFILILSGCKDNTNTDISTKITLPPEIAKTAISATYETYTSNKKDKIAYIKPEGVYIYTFTTKENKFLISSASINSETEVNIDGWSPDDKYIVCDTGSYIEREKIIINSQTGKIITEFGTMEISYRWINSDEIVFTDLENNFMRPSQGAAHGLAIINLNTNQKTILKHATTVEDYSFADIVENNKIIFLKTIYKPIKPEEFKYGQEETSYWIIDKDGKNEKQVDVEFAYDNSFNYRIKSFKYK